MPCDSVLKMEDEEIIEELEKRVKNWAESYDTKSSYTQGKVVGAIHAVTILKDMLKEGENQ